MKNIKNLINRQKMEKNNPSRPFSRAFIIFCILSITSILYIVPQINAVWNIDLEEGLKHYWSFDEPSGSNSLDESGISAFNYNSTLLGGATFTSDGRSGNAVALDGIDDWINVTGFNSSADLPKNEENYTISLWVNFSEDYTARYVYGYLISSEMFGMRFGGATYTYFGDSGSAAGNHLSPSFAGDFWTHIVIVKNGSCLNCGGSYLNGSQRIGVTVQANVTLSNLALGSHFNGKNLSGMIDEVAIWNRSLTATEILSLWNDGAGIFRSEGFGGIAVDLISPINNSNISGAFRNFNASYFADPINLTSIDTATISIWFENSTLFNTTTLNVDPKLNSSSFGIRGFTPANYSWNVEACGINISSKVECHSSPINNTFEAFLFQINSETFDNDTTEGSVETFKINISFDSIIYPNVLGILNYNNTPITASSVIGTDQAEFTATITTPSVTADKNISFFWELSLIGDSSSPKKNSTTKNQTVRNLEIDDCRTHNFLLLNFSLKNEETQIPIGVNFNASVEIDMDIFPIGSTNPIIEFSQNYSKNNNPQVCLKNDFSNVSYEMDAVITYKADAYASELYYIQNSTIQNSSITTNIDLLDLLATDNTNFKIIYKDEDFLPVENALVDIQRRYIDEGVFKTIEIPKTDANGDAVAHLDTDNVIYTIIIKKFGEVLATFDNIAVVCQDNIIGECRINLNKELSQIESTQWETIGDISFTLTFNQSTRTVTSIFTSTDGNAKTVNLNTTKFDRFGNHSVCSTTVVSSSGTLNCVIPSSFGNITIVSILTSNGELITTRVFQIIPDAVDRFGAAGAVMFLILMITIPFMFITSTIGMIIGIFIGLIMSSLLMLYTSGSFLGTSSIILWVVIAGGIIIWKIAGRES